MSAVIRKALATDDVDAAIRQIMDALGIESGDLASHHFDEATRSLWTLDPSARSTFVVQWLLAEIVAAGDGEIEEPDEAPAIADFQQTVAAREEPGETQCPHCAFAFKSREVLLQHIAEKHGSRDRD